MEQQKTLFLESCLRWLAVKAQEFKIPLLSSFLFGLLAYTFNFTNKLINHDEVQCLFSKGAALSSGRWGLNILERVFPNVSMPFLYGIFSLTFIAISVCIIVHIFKIKNHLLQVLLAGSIVVFPSLIGTFAYMFTSCSFALSFLMAVLAVWLIQKTAKFTAVPALCCMVFSLGIYQSYISIAAGLLVLILIQQLLLDEDVKIVLRRGFFLGLSGCFLSCLLCSHSPAPAYFKCQFQRIC